MHLRSLDISGFKSFADKTSIAFGDGITSVVGPNGSGKSNIFDAIRWVLGEQSAKTLRGIKMEDVIFAGSEGRRSLGMAEVSITLDNSSGLLPIPFGEVTISRRVYRSGESEYMLNKSPCRYRDIQELLMDTGVGREAHAIIGQGKIDAILSTRAEERRAIFEDAAGVTRFRVRLHEAARKLEETELNLLRVQDIILELDRQLGPLEVAAEAARVYKQHARLLRETEVRLVGGRYASKSSALQSSSGSLVELQGALSTAHASLAADSARLEAARLGLSSLESRILELQTSLWELTSGLDKTDERLRANETIRKDIAEAVERLEHESSELRDRMAQIGLEIDDTLVRARELSAAEREAAASLSERDNAMSKSLDESRAKEEQLEQMRAEVIELLSEAAKKRNAVKGLDVERELSERRALELTDTLTRLGGSIQEASSAAQAVMDERDATVAALSSADRQAEELGKDAQDVSSKLREREAEEKRLAGEVESRAVRRRVLADLATSYEGYGHGVRAVLTEFARTDGGKRIVGTVADLVSVPMEYERAIDVALGAAVQNIVARDADTARAAIEYLKGRRAGRATFLPLDLVRGGRIGSDETRRLNGLAGVLGVAVDLVVFAGDHTAVFEQLLGRTLVAENMESAVSVSRTFRSQYKIVTLDGEVINAGGSMTGGNDSRMQNSLLARKREMEDLAAAETELRGEWARVIQLKAQTFAELCDIRAQLVDVTQSRSVLGSRLSDLDRDLAYHMRERSRLEAEAQSARDGLDALEGSATQLRARVDQLQAETDSLESSRGVLEREIADLQESLRTSRSFMEGWSAETVDMRLALASKRHLLEQYQRDVDRLELARADITSRAQEAFERMESARQRLKDLDYQRAEDSTFIRVGHVDRLALESELQALRSRRESESRLAAEMEEASKAKSRGVADLTGRLHNTELVVARLEVEIDELEQQLRGVFEISPDEFYGNAVLEPSEERALEADVSRERAFLSGLGDVNLLAEEEFLRTKERRDFLFSQREDLVQAELGLRRIIEETQETARARFMETFEKIQSQFAQVFSTLFQGGAAGLRLSDPADVLGSGIEIHVQPPGKKLQNLSLLSGGERALAAIAVLFAVLKVRPNPFCVMDEIDAALDEVNVTRFADLLRECAQESQFIIVTHRKGTMRVADRLYGVTMEDSGVSKVLSLDLQQATA